MTVYLLVFICTTASLDKCDAYVPDVWQGTYALVSCQCSTEPTKDKLRERGNAHVAAHCATKAEES